LGASIDATFNLMNASIISKKNIML